MKTIPFSGNQSSTNITQSILSLPFVIFFSTNKFATKRRSLLEQLYIAGSFIETIEVSILTNTFYTIAVRYFLYRTDKDRLRINWTTDFPMGYTKSNFVKTTD